MKKITIFFLALMGTFSAVLAQPAQPTEYYFQRGLKHLQQGQTERAIAEFDQALEAVSSLSGKPSPAGENRIRVLDPRAAYVINNRAAALILKGEYQEAIRDLTYAITLHPRLPELWLNRGNAYRECGELDKAAADYERSLALNPRKAEVWM